MRPLTDHTPKPLLTVADKPLIVYQLERLRDAGVKDVVINIAYLGEQICSVLGDGSRWNLRITYSKEPQPLETAGAINQALSLLGDEPFILINGDVWCDYPLQRLFQFSLDENTQAHFVMVSNPVYRESGDFDLAGGRVVVRGQRSQGLTFSGISLLRPQLVSEYPQRRECFALREVFDAAIAKERITGEFYSGDWWDIGTPERLADLDQQLLSTL